MRENYLEDFYSFLRFPSISTDDQYAERVSECANWLVKRLTRFGLETQLVPTRGHPIVWARNKHQPGRRTVLIYGHYDVQPPDPLELWDSPPFEPVLKNGYVFARGATDNKGQILSHILGIQETIEQNGDLPVNLHLVIEGEEEIGSANLGSFLEENRDALKCDVAVVSDTGMIERGVATREEVDQLLAARHKRLDRRVALKVLRPEMATAVAAERFLAEGRILARLSHRNIVRVYDADEKEGFLYYAMEFVEGESLADRLKRGALPPAEAVRLAVLADEIENFLLSLGEIHRPPVLPKEILLVFRISSGNGRRVSSLGLPFFFRLDVRISE